jgi:hypothetical protein
LRRRRRLTGRKSRYQGHCGEALKETLHLAAIILRPCIRGGVP